MHFAAGMNDVALVRLTGEHALSTSERLALASTLSAHIDAMRLNLATTSRGDWLIGLAQPIDAHTVTPQFARAHDLNVALPQGKDAGMLRRLMTELQMLLHEHPVNDMRAARGAPTANAVWLWGGGEGKRSANATPPICVGRNDYLQGVCHLEGWAAPREVMNFAELMSEPHSAADLVVVLDESAQELDSHGLPMAVAALERGHCRRLDLVLDEWHVSLDRWSLKKFWRSARSIDAWARA